MYIVISTEINYTRGPTVVGDSDSDLGLMEFLGAKLVQSNCQTYKHYSTPQCPRIVLDRLSTIGFKLCGMTGAGQTILWTLYREAEAHPDPTQQNPAMAPARPREY